MTIYIIGAGVIGLSTAHALAHAGQSVAVVEALGGAAQAGSFAPCGLISSMPPALWPLREGLRNRLGLLTSGFPTMPVPMLDSDLRHWSDLRKESHARWLADIKAESAPVETATDADPSSIPALTEPEPEPEPEPGQRIEPTVTTDIDSAPDVSETALQDIDASVSTTQPADSGEQDASPTPSPEETTVAEPSPEPAAPQVATAADSLFVRLAEHLQFELEHDAGHLILARDKKEADALQSALLQLQSLALPGVQASWLDSEAVAQAEPGLNPDTRIAGGLRITSDLVANCRQLAMALKAEAEWMGAAQQVNSPVEKLEPFRNGKGWRLILKSGQQLEAEQVVICAGAGAEALLKPLGIGFPLQPAYGYTLTATLQETFHAPKHAAVTDCTSQTTITRQGQRVRISGGYHLGEAPEAIDQKVVRTLRAELARLYPGAIAPDADIQIWSSTVLMTPNDEPIIGPSGKPGLWLNIGHGFHGWAQSLRTAYLLARRMTHIKQDGAQD